MIANWWQTTLFENMIIQDIQDGKGVKYIDPLGDVIEHILVEYPKNGQRM